MMLGAYTRIRTPRDSIRTEGLELGHHPGPVLAGFNPHWPDLNLAVAGFQREQFYTDRQPPTSLGYANGGHRHLAGRQW